MDKDEYYRTNGLHHLRKLHTPNNSKENSKMTKYDKVYENPQNGHKEGFNTIGAFFYALLFAPIYFIYKGAWGAGIFAFVLAVMTAGLSHLIMPFFAKGILHNAYMRKGWKQVHG